tara:strand:- start:290 stop:766 length:477 start_codon:yes stop_codon:yes gene_type:complete
MFKNIFLFLLIISFSFSHFSTEECFQLEDCPKCKECVEKECPPCPELEECECDPCPECPEVCEGTCYTDEEVINIEAFIQQLEIDKEYCIKTRDNMQLELNQWYIQDSTYQVLIKDMEHTIELRDKLIKEVTPKWWENKWLWFGMGVVGMGTLNSIVD